jgi:hypothetical protein
MLRLGGTARFIWLGIALVAAAGCAAAIDQVDIDAARTAARVTTALVNDPAVGIRPIEVRVGPGGVAYLSGRVRGPEEAARAVEVARSVPGVARVESTLEVSGEPTPARAEEPRRRADPRRDAAVEFAELETTYDRLAIGASLGRSQPGSRLLGSRVSVGPLVRIGAGAGFGPAIGFGWFQTHVTPDPARGGAASTVRVRPVMVGLSYTARKDRIAVSPSVVAGYAFNSLTLPDSGAGRLAVGVDNSLVWRPAVSVWIDTSRRTAVTLSVGRVMTSLRMTFVEDGRIDRARVSGNTTIVQVGIAYTLF